MKEFLEALEHARKLQLRTVTLTTTEAENVATELHELHAQLVAANGTKRAAISGLEHRDNQLNQQRATVAAALREALAAIAAIEQNPLATTDRQHVEFTKQDAADIVRAAMEKLGIGEAK